uniref:Ion transport domain-containing protein n=1 Tax=Globisporangium ultimum (strain ATCC 200006 / CBS 805.95 / DAOM BR144) TaxID=431595 RepID=K3WXP3_GLOUD
MRQLSKFRANLTSVIYPTSTLQQCRDGILFCIFVVHVVRLPLLPIYYPHKTSWIIALHFVSEWIYFVDCVLGFNTAHLDKTKSELVPSRMRIAKQYLRGWFWIDVVPFVPVNIIVYFTTDGKGLFEFSSYSYLLLDNAVRIPRFVSFFRVLQTLRATVHALHADKNYWMWVLRYSRCSHILRIIRLLVIVILIEHYMACLWQYLEPPTSGTSSQQELYVKNFYNVVLLIHGQSVSTDNMTQTVYCIVSVFVGLFILAIVLGNIAILVSNFNASSTNYRWDLEGEYDAVDVGLVKFPKELTPTLAFEVGLCQYMNLITRVPFWKDCSPDFVTQAIRNLVVHAYLPDDCLAPARDQRRARIRLTNSTAGESAQVPPKPAQVSAQADRDCTLKPEILHPGEVFGKMGLLLNYQQQSNHDRSIVLAAILEHAIGTEGLSFSMEDVYGISIVKPSSTGPISKQEAQPAATRSGANVQQTSTVPMTPAQAADFLMRKINRQVCDTSIKFGFQQVDLAQDDEGAPSKETKPLPKAASSDGLLPTFVGQTPPPAAAADEPAPRSSALFASFLREMMATGQTHHFAK